MLLWPLWIISYCFKKIALGPLKYFLFGFLFLANITLHIVNIRLPKFILNAVALKDLSTAGKTLGLFFFYIAGERRMNDIYLFLLMSF